MRLARLQFQENDGTPAAWGVEELVFGQTNLILGRNAAGKTRVLSLVWQLAGLISQQDRIESAGAIWKVRWENGEPLEYRLKSNEGCVLEESLEVGGRVRLSRAVGGVGKIWAERLGADLDFQSAETVPAVAARRDKIQHPFLEPLEAWARSVRALPFTSLGRSSAAESLTEAFFAGTEHSEFLPKLREELDRLGYKVEEIGLIDADQKGRGQSRSLELYVKEKRLNAITRRRAMSQGMLRSIALLIHLNRLQLSCCPACILVDDFAEGLDFERASALVELVLAKCQQSSFQLLFSTNERVVMNKVPIEHWSILKQEHGRIRVFNHANSRELFDNFKFTGLSNFDFFSMDFADDQTHG